MRFNELNPLQPKNTLLASSVVAVLATAGCPAISKKLNPNVGDGLGASFCVEYSPPPEGVIIAQKCENPGKPTVVYLPDQHPYKTPPVVPDEAWAVALQTQKDLYAIVHDLFSYPGELPLFIEHWREDETLSEYRQQLASKKPEALREHGNHAILTLLEMGNQRNRRMYAEEFVLGQEPVLAGDVLAAVYPTKIIPRGSVPPHGEESSVLSARMNQFQMAKRDPDKVHCKSESGDVGTLKEVRAQFFTVKPESPIVDCYCTFHLEEKVAIDNFLYERTTVVAQREARAAVAPDEKSSLRVIITGAGHMYEGVRELDRHNVNYLVVAPRVIESTARTLLDQPLVIPGMSSYSQLCTQWEIDAVKTDVQWVFGE